MLVDGRYGNNNVKPKYMRNQLYNRKTCYLRVTANVRGAELFPAMLVNVHTYCLSLMFVAELTNRTSLDS